MQQQSLNILGTREPLICFRRLLLFRSLDPLEPIREPIELRRGLNIIWGIEDDESEQSRPFVGHNVGKTTFCRLLRYCLGEKTFATPATTNRIQHTFQDGYVAAEIELDGELWAIARPFAARAASFARIDSTVDELIADRPPRQSFRSWLDQLARVVTEPLSDGASLATGDPITAEHILSWCSRDQEARYQSFWDWRSPRSGWDGHSFKRPKRDPVSVVRAVLALIDSREVELQASIDSLDEEIRKLESTVENREREPQFRIRQSREALVKLGIEDAETAPLDRDNLLGLPAQVENRQRTLQTELETIEKELESVGVQRSLAASAMSKPTAIHAESRAAAKVRQAGADDHLNDLKEAEDNLQALNELIGSGETCDYGEVTFEQCEHIQSRVRESRETLKRLRSQKLPNVRKRQSDSTALTAAATRQESQLVLRRERLAELVGRERELTQQKNQIDADLRALDDLLSDAQRWDAVRSGTADDSELTRLREDVKTKESKRKSETTKLTTLQEDSIGRASALQQVFNDLVVATLSPEFTGQIEFTDGVPDWLIRHQSELTGEAFETLALLLADVTCLVAGTQGHASHPGLLIHDSPREADLGYRIYHSFLNTVAALGSESGLDPDSAPLQYIITTTTPPPEDLRRDGPCRLQLGGRDGLLFDVRLQSPAPETQPSLFGESDAGEES